METEASAKETRKKGATTKNNDSQLATTANETTKGSSPKVKRRKVNHACLYCRRSHMTCDLERPCTRCIKRNIGHLCHDEPREAIRKSKNDQSKNDHGNTAGEEAINLKAEDLAVTRVSNPLGQQPVDRQLVQDGNISGSSGDTIAIQPSRRPTVSNATINNALTSGPQLYSLNTNEWRPSGLNQFHDVHTFHPSYMFNAPEVTNEYNLLNDFLSTSLLDDGALFPGEDTPALYSESPPANTTGVASVGGVSLYPPNQSPAQQLLGLPATAGSSIKRPPSTAPTDKEAQETYYMTAADPAGSDAPDARINKLLQAKYDAGMLRPFNYVKGYARLNKYMESNMQSSSRQKILRQLDKFRPKFRELIQSLTDVELVVVEMWFEQRLMEYDRVFASLAIPACCWRRTGEIFRGNKEMAELIHVPIESLRDGKLAIHDIIVENHLVSYWEKFGAIAFDNTQKAMLTSCSLKTPDANFAGSEISCCFSFTIRRDEHNIPSLIVGNFLPGSHSRK